TFFGHLSEGVLEEPVEPSRAQTQTPADLIPHIRKRHVPCPYSAESLAVHRRQHLPKSLAPSFPGGLVQEERPTVGVSNAGEFLERPALAGGPKQSRREEETSLDGRVPIGHPFQVKGVLL